MDGAGNMAFLPLVELAHIEEQGRGLCCVGPCRIAETLVRLGGADLVDLGFDLCEMFSVGWHYFPEYSNLRCDLPRASGKAVDARTHRAATMFPATFGGVRSRAA